MSSSLVSGNAVVFATSNGSNPNTASITWSLGSGSNRAVVLAFAHKQTAANRTVSGVTVGGVSFTPIVTNTYGATTNHAHTEIWACNEASAGSIGSNPTISVTYANSGTGMAQGVITTVQDCDQTLSNWTYTDTDDQLGNTTLTCTLSGFTSSSLVIGSLCDNTGLSSYNCQQTGGDATTEFTSSDVTFNTSARAVQFYATADSDPTYVVQRNTSSGGVYCALAITGIPDAVTGPTITSTSDDTPTDGTTLTINGTNFGTNTGSAGVTLGGTSVTPSSWSATAIDIPIAIGSRKYGTNYAIVVTDSSAQTSNSWNVQIQPASGKEYVDLSGTLASSGDRITAVTDLTSGDQLEVSNIIGGTISDVTVNADASFSVASGVTGFDVRANDGTGWGTVGTQNTTPDTTAPTLSSATIGTNGTTLTLVFSEAVSVGAGGNGGFSLLASGTAVTLTYSSGSGSDTLAYTASRTISSTETSVELAYLQPGNGIEDAAGNDLANLYWGGVFNNSTQNSAPTDISITSTSISESAAANTIVGELSATDPDLGDTHTFSLVAGAGDTDNASFTVSGIYLLCNDAGAMGPGTYSVRIRATDAASNTFDEVFSITVTDVLDDRINYITTQTGTDSTSNFTCEVGDLLIGFASRDGSVTNPTLPAGWVSVRSGGANSLGSRIAYKIATGTTETSGTWTNATSLAIVQYRPGTGYTLAIGDNATNYNSAGTNALYPALTLQDTSGFAHVFCAYAHRSADIATDTATANGLTVRAFVQDATDTIAIHTAASVSAFPGATVTYTGTSGSRRAYSVEIRAIAPSTTGGIGLVRDLVGDLVSDLTRELAG